MIDEQRIDDSLKQGLHLSRGRFNLFITSEFWGGRWHKPQISGSFDEINYDDLVNIAEACVTAAREWERLDNWQRDKNYEISRKALGAAKPTK